MKRSLLSLAAVFAAASIGLSACGSSATAAAKVNGEAITRSSVDDELKAIQKNTAYLQAIEAQGAPPIAGTGKGTFNSAFVAQIVTQRILLTVVKQELQKRKLTLTADDLRLGAAEVKANFQNQDKTASMADDFPKAYRDQLAERAATVAKLEASVAKVKVDNAALQAYYDAHKDDYSETCVRHILVDINKHATDAKAVADGLEAQLKGGADFATLAKAKSEDPGSAPQGGTLGCDLSQFIPEFTTAAQKLAVNQISDPVQTQFGYHIIQVTSRNAKPLDDTIRAEIQQTLVAPGQTELQTVLLADLDKAKVTVDPSIGKYTKGTNGQPPTIEPPATTTTTVKGAKATTTSTTADGLPTTTAPAGTATTATTAASTTTTAKP